MTLSQNRVVRGIATSGDRTDWRQRSACPDLDTEHFSLRRDAHDQIAEAKTRVDSAKEAYDLVNLRVQRNLSSKLDLIDAQVKLTSAELDLSDLTAQAYNNRISLIAALGGGFQSN